MKPRIAVVGSLNMDLVFRTPVMPAVGETLSGHEFLQIPGGKGANQAVAAARQGADVVFVGKVGDDGFGAQLIKGLAADGIDVSHIGRQSGVATGVAGILVDDAGANSIVLAAGANATLSAANVDAAEASLAGAAYLLCQLETPLDTVTHAIAKAHALGVRVILNPAPARPLSNELLSLVDILVVNETEARQLSGIDVTDTASALQAAAQLRAQGVGMVLVTMGEHGVVLVSAEGSATVPAVRVQAIDTTAAGDTFVGAFAVALGCGLAPAEACAEAQYAAALTVTRLGAQTSIPTRAEVEAFAAQRQLPCARRAA